jgi:hypothetical protein
MKKNYGYDEWEKTTAAGTGGGGGVAGASPRRGGYGATECAVGGRLPPARNS